MHRRAAFPVVLLVFAVACESPTATPAQADADAAKPLATRGGGAQECAGLLFGGPFENVVVPPGGHCLLVGATVKGDVRAMEGSNLTTSANDISGNVQVERGSFVNMSLDVVGGSISIVDGVGSTGGVHAFSYRIDRVTLLEGNIYVAGNSGGITVGLNELARGSIRIQDNVGLTLLAVTDNKVPKHIRVLRNVGPGEKMVRGNIAGNSIRCRDNAPPFIAESNSAPRLECAGLLVGS